MFGSDTNLLEQGGVPLTDAMAPGMGIGVFARHDRGRRTRSSVQWIPGCMSVDLCHFLDGRRSDGL